MSGYGARARCRCWSRLCSSQWRQHQIDLVGIDFNSMMPKAIQAVEANGVWWSTRKSGANCVFWCLKPSKRLSKWMWCSVVDKTNQAASILPTELGSICIHAIDVTEDSIEAVQDLTSEGQRLDQWRSSKRVKETWPKRVWQSSLQGQACKSIEQDWDTW